MDGRDGKLFPCPCCGFLVFDRPPGSYDLCRVCDWEDDDVQLRYPLAGGANVPLVAAQRAFLGSLTVKRLGELAALGFERCGDWRPLEAVDTAVHDPGPRTGQEYFEAIGAVDAEYYWRRRAGGSSSTPEREGR